MGFIPDRLLMMMMTTLMLGPGHLAGNEAGLWPGVWARSRGAHLHMPSRTTSCANQLDGAEVLASSAHE